MFLYHLKFALRNFNRQKAFSIINILGLTIGLTGCLLAFLFVQDELKFDKHFKNTEHIYQVKGNNFSGDGISNSQPCRFLPLLLEKLPEVISGNRINQTSANIGFKNKHFIEGNFTYTDSNFFSFFGWELLTGNPANVLEGPNKVVLSAKKAKELFGNENPVGKTLSINLYQTYTITGIFKDIPYQSSIKTDYIASISSYKTMNSSVLDSWGNFSSSIFVKLLPTAKTEKVIPKVSDIWNNNPLNTCCGARGPHVKMFLQPYKTIYFQNLTMSGMKPGASLYIVGFSIIAGILLIIALFNFINLSIAQISSRITEAGVKKVLGAGFFNLGKQLFIETSLYVFVAILLSNLLLIALLPTFNSFTVKEITYSFIHNPLLLIFNISIFLFTIISCSLYPAVYFAKVRPATAIRAGKAGLLTKNGKRSNFWDIMVVIQFTMAITLIVTTILVNKQLFFIRNSDPGFERENRITIENGWSPEYEKRYHVFREKLLKYPDVSMVSSGINVPPKNIWNWGAPSVVNNPNLGVNNCGYISVDYDYFKILGCKITEGRDFDRSLKTDENKCIISETFKKKLGVKNPVGLVLTNLWDNINREIIGVVDDITFTTIHNEVKPEIFFLHHRGLSSHYSIIVKFKTSDTQKFISKLEKQWLELAPTEPFTYFFNDVEFESNYRKEINVAKILNILTAVAIFLCCLGLFGLALFVVNNRIKEIGIRKTNGATIAQILAAINNPFIVWITIAYLIACPVAYFLVQNWLKDFAYKTEISIWIFIFAAFITVLVTFLTVCFHSWKAASRNPVEALRYE